MTNHNELTIDQMTQSLAELDEQISALPHPGEVTGLRATTREAWVHARNGDSDRFRYFYRQAWAIVAAETFSPHGYRSFTADGRRVADGRMADVLMSVRGLAGWQIYAVDSTSAVGSLVDEDDSPRISGSFGPDWPDRDSF